MDINRCWVVGQKMAAWLDTGGRSGPLLTFQANREGLQAVSNLLSMLAKEAPGARVTLDSLNGLTAGDSLVSLEHTGRFERPPQSDLHDTRVEAPVDGNVVLWLRVPDAVRETVAQHLVGAGGHTLAQAREVLARRNSAVRVNDAVAPRLVSELKKLGVAVEIFTLTT